ncbi:MAG: hypothetical protein H6979_08705 [Chromatiales bacterium]|nr:hypothetical protein [Chromatiales bacterium]
MNYCGKVLRLACSTVLLAVANACFGQVDDSFLSEYKVQFDYVLVVSIDAGMAVNAESNGNHSTRCYFAYTANVDQVIKGDTWRKGQVELVSEVGMTVGDRYLIGVSHGYTSSYRKTLEGIEDEGVRRACVDRFDGFFLPYKAINPIYEIWTGDGIVEAVRFTDPESEGTIDQTRIVTTDFGDGEIRLSEPVVLDYVIDELSK